MGNKFTSYEQFYNCYIKDPLKALNIIEQGRTKNNKVIGKSTLKLLEKKLKEGNTLKEFYELTVIDTKKSIKRLINTWLTFRDKIDEAKGIYPIKEGNWTVVNSIDSYIYFKEKILNNIEIPQSVLVKFFKVNNSLYNDFKKEVILTYENNEYYAQIIYTNEGKILLDWGEEFIQLLLNMFPDYYFSSNKRSYSREECIFSYAPRCRMMWDFGYNRIKTYFYIDDLFIDLDKILIDEVEVPQIIIKKFFGVDKYLANNDQVQLKLIKGNNKFYAYIKKDGERYLLNWDDEFIKLIKEKVSEQSLINKLNNKQVKFHLKWATNGEVFTWLFDFKDNLIESDRVKDLFIEIEEQEDDFKYQSSILNSIPTKTTNKPQIIPKLSKKGEREIWTRNPQIALESLINAQFRCEINSKHVTFISSKTGENFVEAHHLIPMRLQSNFDYSLDVPGNIVSLCPNCHRAIHHATIEVKKRLLKKLYEKKISQLKAFGISISFEQLLKAYLRD